MIQKNVQVPEGMMKAAQEAWTACYLNGKGGSAAVKPAVEAALHWLRENPVVPTNEQIASYMASCCFPADVPCVIEYWQQHMFDTPSDGIDRKGNGLTQRQKEQVQEIVQSYLSLPPAPQPKTCNQIIGLSACVLTGNHPVHRTKEGREWRNNSYVFSTGKTEDLYG